MTIDETAVLLGIVKIAYPYFYKDMPKNELGDAVSLWADMLRDVSLDVAKLGLKKLIATHKDFPPTIGDLLEAISSTSTTYVPSAGEAWGEVIRAISNYGWNMELRALKSLSPLTRKAVECMGWLNLCTSEEQMADRAHFMKIYGTFELREKENRVLPEALRLQISERITAAKSQPQIEQQQTVSFEDKTVPMPRRLADAFRNLAKPESQGGDCDL